MMERTFSDLLFSEKYLGRPIVEDSEAHDLITYFEAKARELAQKREDAA